MVSSVVTPAICQEGIHGAIDLTLDPAYAPYTFVWSSGATTEDLSGLEPGFLLSDGQLRPNRADHPYTVRN